MTQLSNYAEDQALDLAVGGDSWSISSRHVALATAAISDTTTGTTITEPSGGNYSRATTVSGDWNTPAAGSVANDTAITFPTPSADWGSVGSPIVDMALIDAATLGNIILYNTNTVSKVASVGSTVSFAISAITFSWYMAKIGVKLANALLSHILGIATYSPPATLYLAAIKLRTGVAITSFTNATERVNLNSHGLANGTPIMLTNSGGALPTGLSEQTRYFVVNQTTNDFQLSLRPGGSVVTFSSDGTGTSSYHLAMRNDGGGAVEADYTSYARGSKTNNLTNFPASSGGSKQNANDWTLGSPTGASAQLAEWAVFDANIGSPVTITFTNATNLVNATSHGLANGTAIMLRTTGSLPAAFEANRIYFVINANANDFQLADTEGGSAIDFATDGTGTNTFVTAGNLMFIAPMTNRITPGSGDTVKAGTSQLTFTFA